jgi:hypothetical protein
MSKPASQTGTVNRAALEAALETAMTSPRRCRLRQVVQSCRQIDEDDDADDFELWRCLPIPTLTRSSFGNAARTMSGYSIGFGCGAADIWYSR